MLSQPERDQIVQYFYDLPLPQRSKTNHFNFNLPEWPALFVKYGDNDLLAEASTQYFFHALAQEDKSAPGIPAVYSAFRGNGYYFIVMEKIDLPTWGRATHDYAVRRPRCLRFLVLSLVGFRPRRRVSGTPSRSIRRRSFRQL